MYFYHSAWNVYHQTDLEHCHSDHYLNFTKVVTKASALKRMSSSEFWKHEANSSDLAENAGEPKPSTLQPSEEVDEDPMSPYSAISVAEEASEGMSVDKDAQVMAVGALAMEKADLDACTRFLGQLAEITNGREAKQTKADCSSRRVALHPNSTLRLKFCRPSP